MKDLKIGYFQQNIIWEDKTSNYKHIEQQLAALQPNVDLLVLPETFATGFSSHIETLAEPPCGETFEWVAQMAAQYCCTVVGSWFIQENEKYYNRLYWIKPSGEFGSYDKRHLFRIGAESKTITPGKQVQVFELNGWKISPFICYDLRFPSWMRNTYKEEQFGYDLALIIASWPQQRSDVWKILLQARAVENCSYVIGVGRVGKDPYGNIYSGDSRTIDFQGSILHESPMHEECLHVTTLNADKLQAYRKSFPVYLDWDDVKVSV